MKPEAHPIALAWVGSSLKRCNFDLNSVGSGLINSAVLRNNIKIVEYLLSLGFDFKDSYDLCFDVAKSFGHDEMIDIALKNIVKYNKHLLPKYFEKIPKYLKDELPLR